MPGGGITDLTGLEKCTKLQLVDLSGNSITDLAPLSALPNLAYVFLTNNQVADLAPLSGVATLKGISLANNKVVNLAPLSGLTQLTKLDLWKNKVVNLAPLSGLANLVWLDLRENQIVDTAPLAALTGLTGLALDNNAIGNAGLANLSGLLSLTRLAVNFTQISSLAPLQSLANLHILAAGGNVATDYSPLVNNAGIADGDYVFLGTAIGPPVDCTSIATLRHRGVIVDDLDACQPAPDRTTDRDGDGLSDYDEVMHYCDPTNPDTDNDGMPDGWEVKNGLNPVSQLDDNWDADGDGTSNLNEFLAQTDPNNANDPANVWHVSALGDDTTGTGSVSAPWQTINHAIAAVAALNPAAATIVAQPGIYNEGLVSLPANVALVGPIPSTEQGYDTNRGWVNVIGRILAVHPAKIVNVIVSPDATPPASGADALLTIASSGGSSSASSTIDNVRLQAAPGTPAGSWTCLDISSTAQTVVSRSKFLDQATGIRVEGAIPNIVGCVFARLSGDAVSVLATAVAAPAKGLGNANNPNTGVNKFFLASISGKAVNNQSPQTIEVQNNEWGTQDLAKIQASLSGNVGSPEPILPANIAELARSANVIAFSAATQERILNATVAVSGYSTKVTGNKLGVYSLGPIPRGTYTFTISASGFTEVVKTVTIPLQTDQSALLVPMFVPAAEGEGEGEAPSLEEMAQHLYDHFDELDTNHDGSLSIAEAQVGQPLLTAADFAQLDTNHDGLVSRAELAAFLGLTPGCTCSSGGGTGALVAAIVAAGVAIFTYFTCFTGC